MIKIFDRKIINGICSQIFYNKYLKEKNRISDIKGTTKIPEIVPVYKVNYQDTPHQYNTGSAKVVYLCGENNTFNFREEEERIFRNRKLFE